jgi:hypothetical protein
MGKLKVKEPDLSLDDMGKDLDTIQECAGIEEGYPNIQIQFWHCKLTIPADIPVLRDICKKVTLQNRTIFQISDDIKVGIDVKKEK